LGRHLEVKD
jgi:hypothetical protein